MNITYGMVLAIIVLVLINIVLMAYNSWMLHELRQALEAAHPTDIDGNPIPIVNPRVLDLTSHPKCGEGK